jgi:hypothetical protein
VLGELVQTTAGKWITQLPTRCPNGHYLGPGQVVVGHVACLGHGSGGHTRLVFDNRALSNGEALPSRSVYDNTLMTVQERIAPN